MLNAVHNMQDFHLVRYYNSWIETLMSPDDVSTETTSSVQSVSKTSDAFVNSLGIIGKADLCDLMVYLRDGQWRNAHDTLLVPYWLL